MPTTTKKTTKQSNATQIIQKTVSIAEIGRYIRQAGITADKIAAISFRDDERVDIYTSNGFDVDTKGQIMRPNGFGVNLLSFVRAKDGTIFFETSEDERIPVITKVLKHFVEIPAKDGGIAPDLYFVGFTTQTHQYMLTPAGTVIKLNVERQHGVTHVRFDPINDRLLAVLHTGHESFVGAINWSDVRKDMKRLADPGFWQKLWSDKVVTSISRPRTSKGSTRFIVNFIDQVGRVLTLNPAHEDVDPIWGPTFPTPSVQIGNMLGTNLTVDFLPGDDALTFNVRDFTQEAGHPIYAYLA